MAFLLRKTILFKNKNETTVSQKLRYIYFRHIFIFVFMFIICSIKSFKRISNGDQIAFCKQVAFYLVATTVHVFEEFEQLKR